MNNFALYSLRDRLGDVFRSVTVDTNDMTARRNFSYAVNNSPELLFQSKDLELCKIAEFDAHTGVVVPCVPIVVVCRGDEVIKDAKKDS